MFGMGFMEILLIAVVAIIALGPDKLPTAMVEIAKFIKKFKSGVEDAKSTLDNELNISEMKEEAAKYKSQIEDAKNTLNLRENMDLGLDKIIHDDGTDNENEKKSTKEEKKEKVSLKEPKKKKKKKKEATQAIEEVKETEIVDDVIKEKNDNADAMNRFKVNFDDELEENK